MQTYTDEQRAQVIAEWKAGSSLNQLARAHKMPKGTVQRWVQNLERVQVATQKNEVAVYDLDAMALRLIDGSVSAVSSIHGLATRSDWLEKQNAADLAVLLGVISDKLYRLLGAIRPDTSTVSDTAVNA